jgi:HK97 gp10 family phage protein
MTSAQISTNIGKMIQEQVQALHKYFDKVSDELIDEIKNVIPVDEIIDTPDRKYAKLKSSIKKDVTLFTNGVRVTIHAGDEDYIAFFLEYGTVYMEANPTFRPVLDKHKKRILDDARDMLDKIILKYNNLQ